MVNIQEYVDIKKYSTLKIGGKFRYFTVISSTVELESFYTFVKNEEKYKDIPLFILGGGSNIVFSDGILNAITLKIEIRGFEVVSQDGDYVAIKIGAGEIWDDIVSQTVAMGFSGFESLSAIPGTVGAGPVQNIGAYGSEIKDTILEVEVFDIEKGVVKTISNTDCKFGYRDSIFKNEAKGKYIIISVTYRLYKINETSHKILFLRSSEEGKQGARPSKKEINAPFSNTLKYPGVFKYFEDRKIINPTLFQIRDAIISIRREKLPNPNEIPNVGSFFKNPIVLTEVANKIKVGYPDVKLFPIDEKYTKIPAGWLIEKAGLKGKSFGSISVYDKNALVLVNRGDATCDDIVLAREEIIKIVKEKFGIILEQEPEII